VKKIRCCLSLLFFINAVSTSAQVPIDYETSYLYFLRVNNAALESRPSYFVNSNLTCAWFYSSAFDKKNYENVKNDEFKRNSYYSQLCNTLRTKIGALSFKKEYYIWSNSSLGEYDFSTGSFPIVNLFTDCYFISGKSMLDHDCLFKNLPLTIGWVVNRDCYNYSLKLPQAKAENIINSRKKADGTVDRNLQTKLIFSFVNEPYFIQPNQSTFDRDGFIIYVSAIEFYNNGQLIGSVKPAINFEDPVLGYRVKNGEDTYNNRSIIVNRINGLPNGPVKFYNSDGTLSRIADCSYFFPNQIIFSGDDVHFAKKNNKLIPVSIQQYKKNQKVGYYIECGQSNDGVYLKYVSRLNIDGTKDVIDDPMGSRGHTHLAVNQLPADAQRLIKKYDDGNYFSYSIGGGPAQSSAVKDAVVQNQEPGKDQPNAVEDKSSSSTNENSNILFSIDKGGLVKDYFAGNAQIYNKKSGNSLSSDILFMFINKDDEIPYQKELIRDVSNWLKEKVKLSPANVGNIKNDELLKIELGFAEKFRSYVTNKGTVWYADLTTNIIITKNGKLANEKSFLNSTTMLAGKEDKWVALEDAILKSEKKISKILDDYMPLN
jgi:hypothetical protein